MVTPLFSIGGLASGLDTTAIISQLLQLERIPITRFEQRQAELKQVDDAWGAVNTRLSALRTAVDAAKDATRIAETYKATSSATDVVGATVTGGSRTGALSFVVQQLATNHQLSASFTSADDLVGAGTFAVQVGETAYSVTTDGSTTASSLAKKLNDLGAGVGAQLVKVSDGETRLVLSSKQSGADGAVTVTSNPTGKTFSQLTAARDAEIVLGTGADAITVHRSSNTVTDLIDGVSLALKKTSTDPVTITTSRDQDAAVAKVKAIVDTLNGAISALDNLTSYDADTRKSGALRGDPTARSLLGDLRSLVYSRTADASATYSTLSEIGIEIDRYGAVTFDETKLRDSLADDPAAVGALIGQSAVVSDEANVSSPTYTSATRAGIYTVVVSAAATVAAVTGASYTPPLAGEPKTFTITTDEGVAVSVTLDSTHDTAARAIQRINEQLAAAEVATIDAVDEGGKVRLAETRYGAAVGFTVSGAGDSIGVADGTYSGTDVAGSFTDQDGNALSASGTGRVLTGTEGRGDDLSVTILAAAPGTYGTVVFREGLAGELDELLRAAEGAGGSVQRARDRLTAQIGRYDEQILRHEARLELRERTLRRQFTAMETALAQAQSQGQWLAGQLAGLQANNER